MSLSSVPCAICVQALNPPISVTPCGHSFCRACILPWLQLKRTCPICKSYLPSSLANNVSMNHLVHSIRVNGSSKSYSKMMLVVLISSLIALVCYGRWRMFGTIQSSTYWAVAPVHELHRLVTHSCGTVAPSDEIQLRSRVYELMTSSWDCRRTRSNTATSFLRQMQLFLYPNRWTPEKPTLVESDSTLLSVMTSSAAVLLESLEYLMFEVVIPFVFGFLFLAQNAYLFLYSISIK